ncbi:MAG: HAD family hydrolase [Polyangiaceae bacterium]|nr:HAD family hydrolase [Polyangiaceae bacterium]
MPESDVPMTPRRAALFDMDRTLVRRDTASLFLRYERDIGALNARDFLQGAWWVFLYTLGFCNAPHVAEKALRRYSGRIEVQLYELCEDWYTSYVRQHVSDVARRAVEAHQANGDLVAIVTGALRFAARPLARELGIEHVVCSEVETEDGRLTGRPRQLCFGSSKVELAARVAASAGCSLDDATFYTDSITDLPLLERVRTPVAVNPDSRLRRLAARRGWRTERW